MTDDIAAIANGDFHRGDRFARVLLVTAIVAIIVAIGMTALAITRSNSGPYDPLGLYPTQLTDRPVYHVGDLIGVNAKKCAKTDGVMTAGKKTWIPTDAPGVAVLIDGGVGNLRYKSCGPSPKLDHYSYKNAIPAAVAALVKTQGLHSWRVTGTDTPYKADGTQGVPRTWSTTPFVILP